MPGTLEFIFDFGGPNAYLAYRALPGLLARTGAALHYTPCLLGGIFRATNNRPPLVRYAEIPAKLAYEQLEMERFVKAHGLHSFRINPNFPMNTLMLMRAAIVAEDMGLLDRFIESAMTAMWEVGENMADPDVIARVLDADGFDARTMLARTEDQAVKEKLIANTEHAVARGAFGVPTFFVAGEMFFGKDRLAQVEAALALA